MISLLIYNDIMDANKFVYSTIKYTTCGVSSLFVAFTVASSFYLYQMDNDERKDFLCMIKREYSSEPKDISDKFYFHKRVMQRFGVDFRSDDLHLEC